jgi:hypothetical protein
VTFFVLGWICWFASVG